MLRQLKRLSAQILSHKPELLPVSMPQYNAWIDSIIDLAGPYADKDSMIFAISSQLIHLPHTTAKVPKAYFVNCLRKAAANQVASQVFQDIKIKQQELAKKQAEDTALLEKAVIESEKKVT